MQCLSLARVRERWAGGGAARRSVPPGGAGDREGAGDRRGIAAGRFTP
ncbi:hypothetical protein PV379_16265 [Streptomyces caniscabiei]|nr:hypothetical protein [Streptomyces caniscabiei]MDX2778859.1 hypothetical protein [Streptomyces caniscabiei]